MVIMPRSDDSDKNKLGVTGQVFQIFCVFYNAGRNRRKMSVINYELSYISS
jgi:hypothetical protein